MKLEALVEAVTRTREDRDRFASERAAGRNVEPERLDVFLDYVKNSRTKEEAQEHARKMARWFTKGGSEKFLRAVDNARSHLEVVQLAYNAALKGEGLGVINKGQSKRVK